MPILQGFPRIHTGPGIHPGDTRYPRPWWPGVYPSFGEAGRGRLGKTYRRSYRSRYAG